MRECVATAMVLGLALGCQVDGDERRTAWDPDATAGSTGIDVDEMPTDSGGPSGGSADPTDGGGSGPDDSSDGEACVPGSVRDCDCPDGTPSMQSCNGAGSGWQACACDDIDPTDDGGSTGDDSDGGSTGGDADSDSDSDDEPDPNTVCYPGADDSYSTCLPIHHVAPEGYDYPAALGGDPNYREPIAFLDLEEVSGETMIAPNFRLDELAQLYKGRYAVVQPHAVESLQALRDQVGAIAVNSAYRSPAYNASLDGSATYSRHMYGDGFDLDPIDVGLSTLENACEGQGGMLVEYNTHVHCDFRFDDVDPQFFGAPSGAVDPSMPTFGATLVREFEGLHVEASGFEEGLPKLRWTAYAADDTVLETFVGPDYAPPNDAAYVEVIVGARLTRTLDLSN